MSENQSVFEQIRERLDIVEVIGQYITYEKRGRNFLALCPFHQEKTPSFNVSPEKQIYHCFGCGAHGDVLRFLQEQVCAGDMSSAIDLACKLGGIQRQQSTRQTTTNPLYPLMQKTGLHFQTNLETNDHIFKYLQERGVNKQSITRFQIGYATAQSLDQHIISLAKESLLVEAGLLRVDHEKSSKRMYFRNRLVFPICDKRGRIIALAGRVLNDDLPKYLNSPESKIFVKHKVLYAYHLALQGMYEKNRVFVTEGYMDVIAMHQHGLTETVATMGTSFNADLYQQLASKCSNIIFAFDGDNAGVKAAARVIRDVLPVLRDETAVMFMLLAPGSDPDSFVRQYGKEGIESKLSNAKSIVELLVYLLWHNTKQIMSDEARAANFVKSLAGFYHKISTDATFTRERLLSQAAQVLNKNLVEIQRLVINSEQKNADQIQTTKVTTNKKTIGSYDHRHQPSPLEYMLACVEYSGELISEIKHVKILVDGEFENLFIEVVSRLSNQSNKSGQVSTLLKEIGQLELANYISRLARVKFSSKEAAKMFLASLLKTHAQVVERQINQKKNLQKLQK